MAEVKIDQWAKGTREDLEDFAVAVKVELFSSIIQDTRVKTGLLAGNWQTSTGQPIQFTTNRLDPNYSQATEEVIRNVTPDGVDYMTNNLPYAEKWNEVDGMVEKNLARLQLIVRKHLP